MEQINLEGVVCLAIESSQRGASDIDVIFSDCVLEAS